MLGLPTETPDEMLDTACLVRDLDAAFSNVSLYAPSPGSDLYDWCRQRGLLAEDNPRGYYRNRAPGKVRGVDYRAAERAVELALGVDGWRRLLQRASRQSAPAPPGPCPPGAGSPPPFLTVCLF